MRYNGIRKKKGEWRMIYVTSDLHGCDPKLFEQLLEKAGFGEEDFLFVLGDVIDRGDYGAELLLWLTEQPNVQLILGNHEALMLACDFLFEEVTEESLDRLNREQMMLLESWYENGGGATIRGLRRLLHRDPELVQGILDYLRDAPLYEWVDEGGKSYLLVHGGLGNFDPSRSLEEYDPEELLLQRPGLQDRYFEDATVIFGHTPTAFYGMEYQGRMLRTDTWLDIDTGAAMGNSPMLLRLGDEREFYMG